MSTNLKYQVSQRLGPHFFLVSSLQASFLYTRVCPMLGHPGHFSLSTFPKQVSQRLGLDSWRSFLR
jgi:hypothetical protein